MFVEIRDLFVEEVKKREISNIFMTVDLIFSEQKAILVKKKKGGERGRKEEKNKVAKAKIRKQRCNMKIS